MSFFKNRGILKEAKHRLHEVKHFRRMNEDVAEQKKLDAIRDVEKRLQSSIKSRDYEEIKRCMPIAEERINALVGKRRFSRIRENVEVAVVALSVAMAVRTFFFQPFKIPTGSMQPTLYGITVEDQPEATVMDKFPLNIISGMYNGEFYREIKAKASGDIRYMEMSPNQNDRRFFRYYEVGGIRQKVRKKMIKHFNEGEFVKKGDVIASGRFIFGDHIFVDRVSYNFRKPKRGDVFVFRTDHINYEGIPPKIFYIKRLVGLPGETIQIEPPNLIINGKKWDNPYPANWTTEEQNNYMKGHSFAFGDALLNSSDDKLVIPGHRYLPMGDNTLESLDGRYFGTIPEEDIIGPAFMVYWPFGRRWGRINH